MEKHLNNRGYFGIGIFHPKKNVNIGTLWRSAYNFGASFIFTIGRSGIKQSSDTTKAHRHIPLFEYKTFEEFYKSLPYGCDLIGVEQDKKSLDLQSFIHPERAVYLLGAEDNGLPQKILNKCSGLVEIDSPLCLNVSVAGSIVMYDRQNSWKKKDQRQKK